MYLGIDLGTSGVKAVLVDDAERVIDQETAPLTGSRPRPLWSEQDPQDWWRATTNAMGALKARRARELCGVRGIGLSGQMHGATLLDAKDKVLRPAILWNDGRSGRECAELERREPASRTITGNLAMPGFTAPKLLWVAAHEPEHFDRTAKVLLPKDYLRLRMTGTYVSDMSDSAGTLWLDVDARDWSEAMLAATDLTRTHMPELVEGSNPGGALRAEIAAEWGVPAGTVVAGGGGDNAAGAVGMGVAAAGDAFVSIGTSGVFFVANAHYAPNPADAVHAFCHCLPDRWHQMSVILNAASCLSWLAGVMGTDEATLITEAEAEVNDGPAGDLFFLPYLSGERTPHNDPSATGAFIGLTPEVRRPDLTKAVLEGVAFAFADGQAALEAAGTEIGEVSVIGGGARSRYWGAILASVLNRPLNYHVAADIGPAFGAARLGRLAAGGEDPATVCVRPPVEGIAEPDQARSDHYAERWARYRALYPALENQFAAMAATA